LRISPELAPQSDLLSLNTSFHRPARVSNQPLEAIAAGRFERIKDFRPMNKHL
jgi:hypothetical protein